MGREERKIATSYGKTEEMKTETAKHMKTKSKANIPDK